MPSKIFFTLLLFMFSASFYPILAQSPSATPTPAPSLLSQSENNTVEDVRRAVQEKVKEKLSQITTPDSHSKIAWMGTVSRTDPTQIVIDYHGSPRNINITPDTTVVGQNRQKADPSTLKTGTTLLCMGYSVSTDTMDGKRLVVTDPKTILKQQIVTGKIVDVSQSSPIFVLIPNSNKDIQYQIKTDTKTEIKSRLGLKQKTTALSAGKKVVVILTPDAKAANTYLASGIILLDSPESASVSPTPTESPRP